MSDLLNQASLVMVPSGYKEDTVYSVVPSDGSGDLSFTRASNGTRVNSQGLVEVVPWNLVQNSENFGINAVVNITIGSNVTTAPNGTTTADSMIEDSANDLHAVYNFGAMTYVAGVYSLSCYVKKGIRDWVRIQFYDGTNTQSVWANVNTGVLGTVVSPATASIESVGNGWYRISISTTMLSATGGWAIYSATSDGGTTYTGTNGATALYLWGLQINIGSTAKPYFPTTDRLNVPRLTYQNGGGGCPSLLLEKQSTNLAYPSEDFGNAAWTTTNGTITANSATSPDGTQNADLFADNSTNDLHYCYQFVSTSAGSHTFSFYAKANTLSHCGIRLYDGSIYDSAIFNLSNGTKGSGDGEIESVGNGWYRVSLTKTLVATNTYYNIFLSNGTTYTYSGSGQSIYIWGAQYEASSYKTSYIPTTSSSATRVADECSKTGISSLIGQTSGALFVEFNSSFLESYTQRIFTLSDGTTNNVIGFQLTGANQLVFYVEYGGSNQVAITKSAPAITLGSNVKIAAAYANNDFVFYVNGTQIGTDTSGSVPATSQLRFSEANASTFYLGLIKQVCLFKTRLTNAELASLTTI